MEHNRPECHCWPEEKASAPSQRLESASGATADWALRQVAGRVEYRSREHNAGGALVTWGSHMGKIHGSQ